MGMHKCKTCYSIGAVIILLILVLACCFGFHRISIIDTHEHIESLERADILVVADRANDISKTFLMPSPTETLTLNGHKSFTGYRENTEELFRIAEKYPDKFLVFCTVNPLESDALQYVKSCIERGGAGIKLYNGHSYYYEIFGIPLDSPRMSPIYAYAERNKIPLLYHVNIIKYGAELENVLKNFPGLVMSVPHYMVSSIGIDKVAALLEKYPNLYTDISFGSPEYMASGFRRISNKPDKYRDFINNYHGRVLFGTDMVLTDTEQKDLSFMHETISCYKDILEKRHFGCDLVNDYYSNIVDDYLLRYEQCEPKIGEYCDKVKADLESYNKRHRETFRLNGLNLSPSVLQPIYRENPLRFLKANQY